jgi:AraC-like DNA-binding protein
MRQVETIKKAYGHQLADLPLLQTVQRQVPGSVQYVIKRYRKSKELDINNTGELVYLYHADHSKDNHIQLRFCVSGNFYCKEKNVECDACKFSATATCAEKIETVDLLTFTYSPAYLHQFSKAFKNSQTLSEKVVNFYWKEPFIRTAQINERTAKAIQELLNHPYTDSRENIFINAQTQIILLYATETLLRREEETLPVSRFLLNEDDREKIVQAREILLQHIGQPITIKELSRKVATNECYLKKGFKEVFGTTIFDFYQGQRMEHAKYLLYEKGLSVTEVSSMLGYSSISHFSTAFKKHTGIKPCELLMR